MIIFKTLVYLILFLFANISLASEQECLKFIKTVWKGEKVGKGYQGPITIKFKDKCGKAMFSSDFQIKYDWIGKAGRVLTPGVLRFKKNGTMEYKNNAGSNGKVTLENNKLNWKNIYTGNNYNVNVSKE
ncbi:MAG: hypothetical protein CMM18_06135 [Rhodospirillaceae bacterium]|nr:hypothetical protein [Rhodospirillaceae bacterium]|tara:strand:- start:178 stop:564 length:387 start_codon:yes stop_codon:yes gene_type:complete